MPRNDRSLARGIQLKGRLPIGALRLMRRSSCRWFAVVVCLLVACSGRAHAHGLHGHVHVTGWAIENLPPGELRDFFADPELRNAAHMGALFPDSGYAAQDPYGEISHWEPFVHAWVEDARARLAPFETREAKLEIGFLMGDA